MATQGEINALRARVRTLESELRTSRQAEKAARASASLLACAPPQSTGLVFSPAAKGVLTSAEISLFFRSIDEEHAKEKQNDKEKKEDEDAETVTQTINREREEFRLQCLAEGKEEGRREAQAEAAAAAHKIAAEKQKLESMHGRSKAEMVCTKQCFQSLCFLSCEAKTYFITMYSILYL